MAAFVWAAAIAGNWSLGANWKVGGVAQVAPPTSSDTVTFGSGTGFTQSNCTLDTTGNCSTINFTGYTGTFDYSGQTLNTATSVTVVSGMTLTSNSSSVINATGANASFAGGNKTFNGTVSLTGSGTATVTGTNTFQNLTRTGTAVKTDAMTTNNTQTLTGTLTLGGNSVQGVNRLRVASSGGPGTPRTYSCTGAAVVINGDVDFQDIQITGSPTWTNASSAFVGDMLGNSSLITTNRTTPATQTATGTASFTWSTHGWTSRVPLPQDNVSIPNAFIAGRTITADMPRLGADITFTCTGSPTWTNTVAQSIFGSLTLASGVAPSAANILTLTGRSSHTLTSAGSTFTQQVIVDAPGGTYTLAGTFRSSRANTPAFSVQGGTLATAGFDVLLTAATSGFSISSGATLSSGGSLFTISGTSANNIWNCAGTVTGSPSVTIAAASTNTRTFVGGGQTYGTLTYTVANSQGVLAITGANTFDTLNIGSERNLQLPASTTTTVTNWTVNGVNNGYVYMPPIAQNYASIPDSAALSITGDIDIMVYAAVDDWTPGGGRSFVGKFVTTGNQISYAFLLNTDGTIYLQTNPTGASGDTITTFSTVATGFTDGTGHWVRATIDVNDGLLNRVVKFYTSNDAPTTAVGSITWTQLGTTVTTVGTTSIFDSNSPVELGSAQSGVLVLSAKYYRAIIRNGYDGAGSVVLDANFTTKAVGANTFTESSANAATVTINGVLAQAGDGRVAVTSSSASTASTLSFINRAVSDYITVQDNTATTNTPAYAGSHGVLVSNTTNWLATDVAKGGLLLLGVG